MELAREVGMTKRERFQMYLVKCYGADTRVGAEMITDILQRYDANYNGMQAHWDHVMAVIDERVTISLAETRGRSK